MAEIKRINPPGTEQTYRQWRYAQAVVSGDRVDVAGQVGTTPDHKVPESAAEQARLAFGHLKTVLEAAGSSLDHVTHLTQYLTDMNDLTAIEVVFGEFFPSEYPARTVVQVGALVRPQLKLEIQATAVLKRN